jgi:hypothetical protein
LRPGDQVCACGACVHARMCVCVHVCALCCFYFHCQAALGVGMGVGMGAGVCLAVRHLPLLGCTAPGSGHMFAFIFIQFSLLSAVQFQEAPCFHAHVMFNSIYFHLSRQAC